LTTVSAAVMFLTIYPFAKADHGSITAAFFPQIMASPISCGFRPDAIWNCGKLLTTVIVLFSGLWIILKNRLLVEKKLFVYLATGWLALFYFGYRGFLINHYLILVPFLNFIWLKAGKIGRIVCFNLLVFIVFVYVKPLMGELFVPIGIEKLITAPDLRDLVSPWIKYENIAFLARIFLDLMLLSVAINSVRKCLVKTI